jgi:N-acetylmuramoyl-L-alanine amidase
MKPYDEANAQAIMNFWAGKINEYAICGFLANWNIESNLRSNNAQNSYMNKWGLTDEEYTAKVDAGTWVSPEGNDFAHDHCGYGLSQWTSQGRSQGLWDYARKTARSIGDRQMQLEYAEIELNSSSFKKTREGLEGCQSAGEAAVIIMTTYEKPASMDDPAKQKIRADEAEEFYQKYYGGVTPTPVKKNRLLALSAGHYLYTAGKRCAKQIDPLETREWVLNARIADKLTEMLSKYDGVEVLRLDDPTGEIPIKIEERARISDEHNADFYLAIHHNAGINLGNGGGVVVYHYPLDRNKAQATELYNDVVNANGLRGNRSRPIVETTELYEVCAPQADSILLENGFMDSWTDTPIILTDQFAENTAKGLLKFFVDYWKLEVKPESPAQDILNKIESVRNNIKALEAQVDELLEQLRSIV